jgi:ectoine hydroxylase-related dioxygenase (phytanoyl-CoA dioxygenase family)
MSNQAEFNVTDAIDSGHLKALELEFRKEGYLVLKQVFRTELVQALREAFIREYRSYLVDAEHKDALRVGNRRYAVTVEINDAFNTPDLYANPLILPIVRQLLGPHFVISDFTCVVSLPGAENQHIHCDGTIFAGLPIASLLPPHAVGLLVPLIPFNRNNGVTRIWPGTHLRPATEEQLDADSNFFDPELELGSCMLMDYRLKHRGNANNSEQQRPLLYCNYSAPWYFDSNNFQKQAHLMLSDTEYMKVPKEHKPLFARRNMKLALPPPQ